MSAVTLCEYRFEVFDARGTDDYLDGFAERLDELFSAGWTLPDAERHPALYGWWRLCLFRERPA
jgi:hypothetical protein